MQNLSGAPGFTLSSTGVGVGKTLLAVAAAVHIAAHRPGRDEKKSARVAYVKSMRLLELYRRSYGVTWENAPGVATTEEVRQDFMVCPDLLVLDDLGAEDLKEGDRGGWTREKFFELLDYRFEHRLTTLVTTNLDEADFKARYGGPIASRLLGRSPLVTIAGSPDYRQDVSAAGKDDTDPFEL